MAGNESCSATDSYSIPTGTVMSRKFADYLSIVVFLLVIATVFQQIATSLTEQGIASGGPYDNAASYPRSLAIIIGLLLAAYVLSLVLPGRSPATDKRGAASSDNTPEIPADNADADGELQNPPSDQSTSRGAALLLIFMFYLILLPYLGYQLATPLMLGAILILAGARHIVGVVAFAVLASIGVSFVFEVFLNVVLPGGVLSLNMPWPSL